MPTHGLKMKKFYDVVMPSEVKVIVKDCGLLPLVDYSLTMLDDHLLTDFVKQWHKETSSSHLPFGELTIVLSDVSSLFHISLTYSFFTAHIIIQETAHMTFVHYL